MNEKNEIIDSKIDDTVATLITYKKLCDVLNTDEIIAVSTEAIRKAIRDGLIYSHIHGDDTIAADVLDYSLYNLLTQKSSSIQHAMHVLKGA